MSWAKTEQDDKRSSWGDSKSWSWGAKNESWGASAKEEWDRKGHWGGQKRSWGDSGDSEAKRGRWQDDDVKSHAKEEAPLPGVPRTPVGAGGTSAPRTPGAAFDGGMRGAPMTPAAAFGASPVPRTPAGAFAQVGRSVPMTPAGAFAQVGRSVPMTPAAAFAPAGVGPAVPQTPAGAFTSGAPAGAQFRVQSATPAGAPIGPPGTPQGLATPYRGAGAPGTPGLGGMIPRHTPSTPGGLGGSRAAPPLSVMNRSAAMTPAQIRGAGGYATPGIGGQIVQQQNQIIEVPKKIFNDGSADPPLKYAPRRKSSTGEQPDMTLPAKVPESWKSKDFAIAGSRMQLKVAKDPIPDFETWRKNHRRRDRPRVVEVRPAPGQNVPSLPASRTPVRSKNEDMTPAQGDMTPYDGQTPQLPPGDTPRMPGVDTPGYGAETPANMLGGDETPGMPRVPRTNDGEPWSKGEGTPLMGMGDATPPVVPQCPPRADLWGKVKGEKEQTPQESQHQTPQAPDYETPQAPPEGHETPGLTPLMPGMETPLMPPQKAGAGDMTPMPGNVDL